MNPTNVGMGVRQYMNLKILIKFFCMSLISFSVEASSLYQLYELKGIYDAKCVGIIKQIDIKTITQIDLYSSHISTNNNFGMTQYTANSYEGHMSLFSFDVPTAKDSSSGPKEIFSCQEKHFFQSGGKCLFKQITSANYLDNILTAEKKKVYLDGAVDNTAIVTESLSLSIAQDKTLNFTYQKVDSKQAKNNESYQCVLTKTIN
jgi:hypothetical protein